MPNAIAVALAGGDIRGIQELRISGTPMYSQVYIKIK